MPHVVHWPTGLTSVVSPCRRMAQPEDGDGSSESETKLKGQIRTLKEDLDRRQESYIRRERDYRTRIQLLEEELQKVQCHSVYNVIRKR